MSDEGRLLDHQTCLRGSKPFSLRFFFVEAAVLAAVLDDYNRLDAVLAAEVSYAVMS